LTSDDQTRPSSRPPRRRPTDPRPASSSPDRADQGDLWADPEAAPPDDGLDSFVAGLPPSREGPPPAARPAAARRPVAPPPDYDDDDYEPEYSMLRNPFVLAALAVAGAIILAVAFVIAFSSGGDNPAGVGSVSRTPTPLPGELPGVQAKVIAIAAIREGPGLEFFELGLLKNGQDISVVGRNEDSSWYQVLFAGTELKGWVPDSALRLPDGADDFIEAVVFTPIPKPSVEQPTATPPPVTPTEEALGPPDIAVELLGNLCPSSGVLTIALRNVGDVAINARQIVLTVSNIAGVVREQSLSLTLGAGQIVPINTGVELQAPRTTVAVVFASAPQDTDPSNNVVTCVVSDGGPGQNSTAEPPGPETPTP
jgi:hypothetical protein